MNACWCVMLQTEPLDDFPLDGAFLNDSPLSWIAREESKPGRPAAPRRTITTPPSGTARATGEYSSWVLHASTGWSNSRRREDPELVCEQLIGVFARLVGRKSLPVDHAVAHLWNSALAVSPLDRGCLWDASAGLGVCGDWCSGSRVEGAFLSGQAMAGAVLRSLTIDRPKATVATATAASR